MKELAHGAAIIGSSAAIEIGREASAAAIDRECRERCSWFIDWARERGNQ
jgi:hypothetical protein